PPPIVCPTFYPTTLQTIYSRYPDQSTPPSRFFMLVRQGPTTFDIAMQVQFTGLPPNSSLCRLELLVPSPEQSAIQGPDPRFNVWAVEREENATVTWETFEGSNHTSAPDQANPNATEDLNKAWKNERPLVVGELKCNETLTFQMGFAGDGGEEVNYWQFVDVSPPAVPAQGWRV
ncbi:hypothetical protein K504DRAFT_358940, partial [Pleomassaria siparia CBS 279.74]